jgi:hypothetical protein
MDKKTKGGIAALVGALLYGGAELLDMDSRLGALEAIHPELVTDVPMDEGTEAPGKSAAPVLSPTDPAPGAEPAADPAPGADHLELDESGEWVEAEAPE